MTDDTVCLRSCILSAHFIFTSFAAAVLSPDSAMTKRYLALVESKRPDLHSGVPNAEALRRAVSEGVVSTRTTRTAASQLHTETVVQSEVKQVVVVLPGAAPLLPPHG
jgi:hypothetical protein